MKTKISTEGIENVRHKSNIIKGGTIVVYLLTGRNKQK